MHRPSPCLKPYLIRRSGMRSADPSSMLTLCYALRARVRGLRRGTEVLFQSGRLRDIIAVYGAALPIRVLESLVVRSGQRCLAGRTKFAATRLERPVRGAVERIFVCG